MRQSLPQQIEGVAQVPRGLPLAAVPPEEALHPLFVASPLKGQVEENGLRLFEGHGHPSAILFYIGLAEKMQLQTQPFFLRLKNIIRPRLDFYFPPSNEYKIFVKNAENPFRAKNKGIKSTPLFYTNFIRGG